MIRFGQHVESPLIGKGEADFLLAYEELEAMRWAPYVKTDGQVIMNAQQIASAPIALGAAAYPDDPVGRITAAFPRTKVVEATNLARQAGNSRAANLAMLGALAADLTFTKEQWIKTIEGRVPAKTLEVNLKAFNLGWEV
jgi:indolepyruvate ferredoxin oxidoreductase beta subunit